MAEKLSGFGETLFLRSVHFAASSISGGIFETGIKSIWGGAKSIFFGGAV